MKLSDNYVGYEPETDLKTVTEKRRIEVKTGNDLEKGYEFSFEIKISDKLKQQMEDAAQREGATLDGYIAARIEQVFESESEVIPTNESIPFMMDNHVALENKISELMKKEGVDFTELRKGKLIGHDRYGKDNGFWLEEHLAAICWILYTNLPIKNRIEWLSKFLGRTEIQISDLLGLYVHLSFKTTDQDYRDGYCDLWIIYSAEISDYFEKYHRYNPLFKYKG